MLIKEYRIPMPVSVEEYRIAQLYMIAKKCRIESEGQGSGVEIIKNEPYYDEKTGEKGQFTIKNYYFTKHLPTWMKGLFENAYLSAKEEAWNAYPYTKTIYTCALFNKFKVEIDTIYLDDPGIKTNVFNLKEDELKNVQIEYIDIVKNKLAVSDYKEEEDPLYYVSEKTGRGPLSENWLEEYTNDYLKSVQAGVKPKNSMMCAYKLCKVNVNLWAMRARIEKFIDDIALRKTMIGAHKQAWCWQDEWFGLTMDDIREIEKDTQKQLALKMNKTRKSSRVSITVGEEIGSSRKKKSSRRSSSNTDNDFNIVSWRIEKIVNESEDSNEEYYDAKEAIDASSLCKWSSLEYVNKLNGDNISNEDLSNLGVNKSPYSKTPSKESLTQSNLDKKSNKCSVLIFVLHGGHLLDIGNELNNKYSDFSMLKSTFEKTMRTSYSNLIGRLEFKLICCPLICKSSLQFLSKLSSAYKANGKFDYETLPIDCLPLFATNLADYQNQIDKTVNSINQSYSEFKESENGKNFDGRIVFICDFMGGILAYDSLCNRTNVIDENVLKYDFQLDDLFLFGCPLSLIIAYRKLTANICVQKPQCTQVYNLFHSMDRLVMRLEPLIEEKFSEISSISVPKYQKQVLLRQIISIEKHLKFNQHLLVDESSHEIGTDSNKLSSNETDPNSEESNSQKILKSWWGKNRIDYELYSPHGINTFPNNTLPILFHSSFWESNDVVSFVLDKLMQEIDPEHYCEILKLDDKLIDKPKEKWLKKSTSFKIKNINSNHRANDIIVKKGQEQILIARFMYGPLDVVTLVGEKVDIYIMKDMNKDDWTFLGTELTDKTGKIHHVIQDRLDCGIYPVKMIVRGDHSSIDLFLTILPPQIECVVFSIDGSFTASISVTGKDPKVRPCAVDIVRYWQDLGYLIIYITARPGFQQQRVLSWLSNHNFPFGLIYFTGGITTDPLKHKAMYLERLQNEVEISIHAAYGSAKDIWIYQTLGLNRDNIFIVGKVSKKQQHLANIITDGYANHLEELKQPGVCRRANNDSKITLPKGKFGLCGITGFCGIRLRRKNRASRTSSYPLSNSCASTPKLSSRLSNNNSNILNVSSNSTLDTFKSISVNHSPTSNSSNPFTNFFHNRTSSNKYK